MSDLIKGHESNGGPVECLGQTFPSDKARREHFLELLAAKLKDPAFRQQEGFPRGTDESILALSDPPYYTACPNPFLADLAQHLSRGGSSQHERREPFCADVKEGKNDPIYNAHSYHTKVPHKAVMRYMLHYTNPGDVVLDSFCGTGMTGVAAQMCGSRREVEALGYRVEDDGTVFQQLEGGDAWVPFSRIGVRTPVLNDLAPAATFIARNFNASVDAREFESRAREILSSAESKYGWMYQTLHQPTDEQIARAVEAIRQDGATDLREFAQVGWVNFLIWSDVFSCGECAHEINFWEAAADREAGQIKDEFACPGCGAVLSKKSIERVWASTFDSQLGRHVRQAKQVPVAINYSIGKRRFEKRLDVVDHALIERSNRQPLTNWVPVDELMSGDKTGEPIRIGVTNAHHFYTHRALLVLSHMRDQIFKSIHQVPALGLWFTSTIAWTNKLNRLLASNYFGGGGGVIGQTLQGTLYISSVSIETNPLERFSLRISSVPFTASGGQALITTGSASSIALPDASIDYIFIDPPFGANIMYSELNFLWESWLKVSTNSKDEAIENRTQKKNVSDYRHLMQRCFREAHRLLKPGRWMTVEFSNTKASVWNAIQTALQEAGFVVGNVSVLEKTHKGFKAVTTTTAVKQDLVISAYKPNAELEERFSENKGSEESVWDFVRTHLLYLPVTKLENGVLEFVVEREPRIIFDRMIVWFIRHNAPVPISSQEFQAGLSQRFAVRDGMVFLFEQAAEYDKRRATVPKAPQMELFVSDERSAIDWLADFLRTRSATYQEIHPAFIAQLGAGWKKHESKPELSTLLENNFLKYDGTGEVPTQIHTYLSSNYREFRGLEKSDPALRAKAQDRWYVPDPNKAQDLEKKREKALLKEFDSYTAAVGRKLKEFRLEVLRAGFKTAWASRDYQTIIKVAQKIPEESLQEDEKLLLWYDQALTRVDASS